MAGIKHQIKENVLIRTSFIKFTRNDSTILLAIIEPIVLEENVI